MSFAVDDHMPFLIFLDPVWFRKFFWEGDLGEGPSWEQLLMFCDESDRVLLCTGRKIAKTVMLEATVIQDGVTNVPNKGGMDEAMFTTPGDAHMNPFLDRVYGRLEREAIFRMLLVKRPERGDNPKVQFRTGLTYYFRIEGMSGTDRNMAGLRAKYIRGDEQAFGNFVNHNSRLQTALPDAKWLYAGVPNGVRTSPFYALDQTHLGARWSRHKYPTYINPLYRNEAAHERLIRDYGGIETQGYQTQVLGHWGAEVQSSFPPEVLAVHPLPYHFRRITARNLGEIRDLDDARLGIVLALGTMRCHQFAFGWDYGFSPDPSILMGAVRQSEADDDWKVVLIVEMRRVPSPAQKLIVEYCVRHLFQGQFVGLSSDNVEAIHDIQYLFGGMPERFIVADPGGATSVPVMIRDETSGLWELREEDDGDVAGAAQKLISVPNKELFTVRLRNWMVNARNSLAGRRLWLPNHTDLLNELTGTTEAKGNRYVTYLPPVDPNNPKRRIDHRCLVAGTKVYTDKGDVDIENIRVGDNVVTRRGYRKVVACGLSNPSVPTWRLISKSGLEIEGTHNHPVWVDGRGFVELDMLRYLDKITVLSRRERCHPRNESSPTQLCSAELSFAATQTLRTHRIAGTTDLVGRMLSPGLRHCIERFGKAILGLFQRGTTFITRTATRPITTFKILSAFLGESIKKSPSESTGSLSRPTLRGLGRWRVCGTNQKRGANGTGNTRRTSPGDLCRFRGSAPFAERNLRPRVATPGSVQTTASLLREDYPGLMTRREPVLSVARSFRATSTTRLGLAQDHVAVVFPTGQEKPVYNLQVEVDSEYFANGILVHNTDSLRYLTRAIVDGLRLQTDEGGEDALLEAMGWAGDTDWTPPWEIAS